MGGADGLIRTSEFRMQVLIGARRARDPHVPLVAWRATQLYKFESGDEQIALGGGGDRSNTPRNKVGPPHSRLRMIDGDQHGLRHARRVPSVPFLQEAARRT